MFYFTFDILLFNDTQMSSLTLKLNQGKKKKKKNQTKAKLKGKTSINQVCNPINAIKVYCFLIKWHSSGYQFKCLMFLHLKHFNSIVRFYGHFYLRIGVFFIASIVDLCVVQIT